MTRKFKAVGIALFAVLAMSAVVASAASATTFTASGYPVSYSGSQDNTHVFTADGKETTCKVATFSGSLAGESSTASLTPVYEECLAGGLNATIDMNGCTYEFHLPAEGTVATVDLDCTGTNKVVITAASGICKIEVPPFAGKEDVSTENGAGGTIKGEATVSGIEATMVDSSPFLCPFEGHTTVTNATYNGKLTLTAAGGKTIDVG